MPRLEDMTEEQRLRRAFANGWAAAKSGDFPLMSMAWSAFVDWMEARDAQRGEGDG